jgi:hypothetical protein
MALLHPTDAVEKISIKVKAVAQQTPLGMISLQLLAVFPEFL